MTYLIIITTVLVLTQIARVAQNATQLTHIAGLEERNELVMRVYQKIEKWLDGQEGK